MKTKFFWTSVLLAGTLVFAGAGCNPPEKAKRDEAMTARPEIPRGFTPKIQILHKGRLLKFGPFVGYYFAPAKNIDDLTHLRFVCLNERGFYASDAPVNALLYEGEAYLTELPDTGRDLPAGKRINPVFFSDAPEAWLATRPTPQNAYRHFHSCYDVAGPVRTGYWLKHVAQRAFTYDMGGRVAAESSLYHSVSPGIDQAFDQIIEFDRGPE